MSKKEEDYSFNDDYSFDQNEWGDIGDDPFNPKTNGNRSAVVTTGKSLIRGAAGEAKSLGLYKNILKSALPDSFSVTLDNVDMLSSQAGRTYQQVTRDAKPIMREVRRIAGSLNRAVPSPFQKKIDEYLRSKDKRGIDLGQVDAEEYAARSGVDEIFAAQEQDDKQIEKAEKLIDTVKTDNYQTSVVKQLMSINRSVTMVAENQLKIQRAWQRKSLEIQIRHLFISRQTLEITKQGMEENSMLLRDIVKNTGLPDVVKEQNDEAFHRQTRERIFGAVQGKVADWTRPYFRNVGNRLNKRLKEKSAQFLYSAQQSADMFQSVEEQIAAAKEMGIDLNEMSSEMIGQGLAGKAGSWLGGKIKKHGGDMKAADNFFRGINYRMAILPQILAKWGRGKATTGYGTWLGELGSILNVPLTQDTTVKHGGFDSLAANMGRGSNEERKLNALEVIIPGYLSRILESSEKARLGTENVGRVVFDPQKNTFTSFKESAARINQQLISDEDLSRAQEGMRGLIDDFAGNGLTRREKGRFSQFLNEKSKDRMFTWAPDQILESNDLSKGMRKKLRRIMTDRYGLVKNDEGKLIIPKKGASGISKLQKDLKGYSDYRDFGADVFNRVKGFSSLNGMDQLIAIGAVKWDERTQTYEYDPEYINRRSNGEFDKLQWGEDNSAGRPSTGPIIDSPWGNGGNGGNPNAGAGPSNGPSWADRTREKLNGWGNRGGSQGGVIKAIKAQTREIVEHLAQLPVRDVQEEQADYLSEILEKLHSGVNTFGQGGGEGRPGLIKRGYRLGKRMAKGLWKAGSYPFSALKFAGQKMIWNPGKRLLGWGKGKLSSLGKLGWDKASALVTDVYVNGQAGLKRALERAAFEAGHYIDMNTGKVIASLKDITGSVRDTRTGEIVITQEEFENGLLDSMGKRLKTGFIKGIGNALSKARKLVMSPITAPLNVVKKGYKLAKKFMLTPPDVYLRGQMERPVMYGEQMYNGMYWSSTTNKVVRYLGDIDGDIYTWDNETKQKRIVLTAQQIQDPGLVDCNGEPLKGFLKKWKDRISGAKNFLMKNLNPMNMLKKIKNVVTGGLGGIRDFFRGEGMIERGWTKRIYTLLYNKFTGRPLDDGLEGVASQLGSKVGGVFSKVKGKIGEMWANRHNGDDDGDSFWKKFVNSEKFAKTAARFGAFWEKSKEETEKKKKTMKERLDEVRNREGSWLNRLSKTKGRVIEHFAKNRDDSKRFPWLPAIMAGFGIVKSTIAGFKKSVGEWFTGMLPKLLGWLKETRGAKAIADIAGSVAGGRMGRAGRAVKRGVGAVGRGIWNTIRHPFKAAGKLLKGAGKVAGFAARALPWVARGVMAVATSPIAWGVAAVAGVGYLIYKGYKKYQGRITSVREMRLAQYGLTTSDSGDRLAKVLALEEACMKAVKYDNNGVPSLGEMNYSELLGAFDIPVTAEKSVLSWANWFTYRFRPVFLKNLMELRKIDMKASLLEPNTTLQKGQLPAFALATRLPDKNADGSKGPYFVEDSPFIGHSCTIGTTLIDSTIEAVVKEYSDDAKKYKEQQKVSQKLGNAKALAYAPKAGKEMAAGMQLKDDDKFYAVGDVKANIGRITGDPDKDIVIIKGNLIDDMTAIRMKIYGMQELSKSNVNLLFRFEQDLLNNNIKIKNGTAEFVGDKQQILQLWASSFGISLGNSQDVADWKFWFEHRFLPSFLNFVSRSTKYVSLGKVLSATRNLKADEQLSIAEFMNSAKTVVNDKQVSVWTVSAYPFPMESANVDSMAIAGNLKSLKERQKEETYVESLAKKDPNIKRDKDGKIITDDAFLKRINRYPGSPIPTGSMSGMALANQANTTNIGSSARVNSYDLAQFGTMENITPNGGSAGELPQVDAAKVSSLKNPDERYRLLKPLFDAVSKMVGVDPAALIAFAMQESGFDPFARAKTSSATGLFQFIKSTWDGYVPKLKAVGFANPMVTDPVANTVAGAMFLRDNSSVISKTVGRAPTIPELYLAHFLGPAGARRVLSSPDDTDIRSVVTPDAYAANQRVFNDAQTVAGLKKWAAEKAMKKGMVFAAKYNGGSVPGMGFKTDLGPTPTEAGSIVNTQQMGTPTGSTTGGAGSMPFIPDVTKGPGAGNSVATGPLPSGPQSRSTSATGSAPAMDSPLAAPREVINQKRVQEENKAITRQQEIRAADATVQTQNRAVAQLANSAKNESEYRQQMLDKVVNIDKVLSDIHALMTSGKGGNGSVVPPNTNKAELTEQALMKNAANGFSGPKGNSLPFNTNRR